MLTYVCTVINEFFSFVLHTNKSSNKAINNISKLPSVNFNTSKFAGYPFNASINCNNKFKRFYSFDSKTNCSEYPLNNDEFSLDKESTGNSNKDFNIEEDLKSLHSLYIKDLLKDRIAPVIPFDSNLIIAYFNISDIKEKSEFLKE